MAVPPVMKHVYSGMVDSVGYDAEAGALYVMWNSGKKSIYEGVPPDVARSTMNAWSVGKALREGVISNFEHRYLDEL